MALLNKRILGGITSNVTPIKFMEYYYYLDRMPPFLLDPYYSRASQGSLLEMCDFKKKKKTIWIKLSENTLKSRQG